MSFFKKKTILSNSFYNQILKIQWPQSFISQVSLRNYASPLTVFLSKQSDMKEMRDVCLKHLQDRTCIRSVISLPGLPSLPGTGVCHNCWGQNDLWAVCLWSSEAECGWVG